MRFICWAATPSRAPTAVSTVDEYAARRPAYLWAAFTKPGYRVQLLHGGWKDIRTPFLVSAVLDAIYQLITHRFIYPLELLFTATLLALVPYLILRGPVNRIAGRFIVPDSSTESADKNAGNRPK